MGNTLIYGLILLYIKGVFVRIMKYTFYIHVNTFTCFRLEELSVPISCLSSFDTLSDESIARKFSSLKCLVITNISSTNLSLVSHLLSCNPINRACTY